MTTNVLAIDIGGTNTKLALVDPWGNIGQVETVPTFGGQGVDAFLFMVAEKAKVLCGSVPKNTISGIGLGVAGFIDGSHETMIFNPNIAWLEGVNLSRYFSKQIGLPVQVEIDSNAAALAESVHGAGKNSHRLLVLAIGTGLGGGMVVDGQVLRVANECLGDVGHVIVEPGSIHQCASGCRGCAEAMVSVSALERYGCEFFEKDPRSLFYDKVKEGNIIDVPEIIAAAKQNDRAAENAVKKLGSYLGIALASIAPVLAPDLICIAGGISEADSILIDAASESFHKIAGPPYAEGVTIQKAVLGWQSVLVGAAEVFRMC